MMMDIIEIATMKKQETRVCVFVFVCRSTLIICFYGPRRIFEIMYYHLILILILATLIGNGSSSRYGSSGVTLNDEMPTAYASRLRSSRKLGIKKVRKGRKAPQTDEEYPDHGQSNLGKLWMFSLISEE